MTRTSQWRYVADNAPTKFILAENLNFTFCCHYECGRGLAEDVLSSSWLVPPLHTADGWRVARGEADVTLKVTLRGRWGDRVTSFSMYTDFCK